MNTEAQKELAKQKDLMVMQAIDRSISHNEIVHIDDTLHSVYIHIALADECEDWVDAGKTREYWGEREGGTWRIHVDHMSRD